LKTNTLTISTSKKRHDPQLIIILPRPYPFKEIEKLDVFPSIAHFYPSIPMPYEEILTFRLFVKVTKGWLFF